MPLDQQNTADHHRLALLDRQFEKLSTAALFERINGHPMLGRLALSSSFGAEAAVLLHLAATTNPDMPVLFIDTELLFPETLIYQTELAAHLGLTNVITVKAGRVVVLDRDPDNLLNHSDPDACCTLRKTEPLEKALKGYDSWITGRKRFHGGGRGRLPLLELDHRDRIKINPLYNWSAADITAYRERHKIPGHPLMDRGYASIGCRPCTRPLRAGEAVRDGRWDGSGKTECGIHLPVKGAA